MPYAVKLLHPGAEREVLKCEELIKWAKNEKCTGHRRKFLSCEGQYLTSLDDNPICERAMIMFWAEWEPPSQYKKIIYPSREITDELPSYIHTPIIRPVPENENVLNTDPYVLGKAFYYSCCQMKRLLALHDLTQDSIILFGSRLHHRFVLDTVFVVEKVVEANTLTPAAYEAIIAAHPKRPPEMPIYQGKVRTESQKEMFSFFPCLPFVEGRGFKRPTISFFDEELNRFGIKWSDNQGQGFACTLLSDVTTISLWHVIVKKVLDAGLCLGVYAQEPAMPDNV